jgi:hypothetical protein
MVVDHVLVLDERYPSMPHIPTLLAPGQYELSGWYAVVLMLGAHTQVTFGALMIDVT